MARTKTIQIRDQREALLPSRTLPRLAREHGLPRRERKVRATSSFWALVLGFAGGRRRPLAGLRRAHEETTGTSLAPSAFYDRFTPSLVRMLKAVVARLLAKVATPTRALTGPLAAFRDLVLTDATVIRLHALLERVFPACRTNHTKAALKIHAVISATSAGPRSIKVASERVHDGPVFRVGACVRDRLLVFDLAYFRFQLFSCMDRNGGSFIVRLKKSANPPGVAPNRRRRGRSVPILGRRASELIERLQAARSTPSSRSASSAAPTVEFATRRASGRPIFASRRCRRASATSSRRSCRHHRLGRQSPAPGHRAQGGSAEAVTPDVNRPLLLLRVESRTQFQHRLAVGDHA